MRLSLGNLIQAKTVRGEQEDKFDIFALDFSTSYNFEAKEKKLGNLSTRFRLKKWANFDVSTTHSFYKFGETSETDEYLWKDGSFFNKRFLRLTSLRAGMRFSKKGGVAKTEDEANHLKDCIEAFLIKRGWLCNKNEMYAIIDSNKGIEQWLI